MVQVLLVCLLAYLLPNQSLRPMPSPSWSSPMATDTIRKEYWLALGDSYTIGESVRSDERYPDQTAQQLAAAGIDLEPEILARTGWTTDDLQGALKKTPPRRSEYDIVTLLIGVNNQYQGKSIDDYAAGFLGLLQQAVHLAGNKPDRVIVLSIPDYSVTPFARDLDRMTIMREIDKFNLKNRELSREAGVRYLDITVDSRQAAKDPSLVASDGLHFSGKAYGVWAAKLAAIIMEIEPGNNPNR
jgi:lysophospholipase L1-like esterase